MDWFKEFLSGDMVALVITFLGALAGVFTALSFAGKKIKQLKELFKKGSDELSTAHKENEELKETNKKLVAEVRGIKSEQAKIFKAMKTAFLNDPKYVANGVAKQIAEELNEDENKT